MSFIMRNRFLNDAWVFPLSSREIQELLCNPTAIDSLQAPSLPPLPPQKATASRPGKPGFSTVSAADAVEDRRATTRARESISSVSLPMIRL